MGDYVCTIVESGMSLIGNYGTMCTGVVQHGCVVGLAGNAPTLVSNALLRAVLDVDYPLRVEVCWWSSGPSMLVCAHVYLVDNNRHVLNLLKQDPMSYLGSLFSQTCFVCHLRQDALSTSDLPHKSTQLIRSKGEFHAHPLGCTEIPLPYTNCVIVKCIDREQVQVVDKEQLPYHVPMLSRYFPPGRAIILDAWNLDVIHTIVSKNTPVLILTDPRRLPQFECAFPHAVINSPDISTSLHVGCIKYLSIYAHTTWTVVVVDNLFDNSIQALQTTALFWRISTPKLTMEQVAAHVLGYAPVHPQEVQKLWSERLVHCVKPIATSFVMEEHVLGEAHRSLDVHMPSLCHSVTMVDSSQYPSNCWKSTDPICPICMELSTDSSLQCGHVFCAGCMQKVYEHTPRLTYCPVCRAQATTHYIDCVETFLGRIMPPRATAVRQWLHEYKWDPETLLCLCSGERVKTGMRAVLSNRVRCLTWNELEQCHLTKVRHIVCFRGDTEDDMRSFGSNYRHSGVTFEEQRVWVHVF